MPEKEQVEVQHLIRLILGPGSPAQAEVISSVQAVYNRGMTDAEPLVAGAYRDGYTKGRQDEIKFYWENGNTSKNPTSKVEIDVTRFDT